ncbi:MAG TPA: glycosyltransferase family 39 protein, partial [Chitinophagaceae bacterium]|nr:glycosyltransferase family 39 protein [Chitinophagaceae bacterium]
MGYNSVCRMPGLLPVYFALRFFLDETGTKVAIILLQFLVGVFSVWALGRIARYIFNAVVSTCTIVLYSISTFVSVWDHYGYSDSFSVSFMIISIYLLLHFRQNGGKAMLLLSGLFYCWSVFFRPINIVILPVMLVHLIHGRLTLRSILKSSGLSLLFVVPLVVCLALWVSHTRRLTGRFILLQDSMSNCYPNAYPEHYQKMRDLSTAWGGDYQRNTVGGEMNWFLDKSVNYKKQNPFSDRIYTKDYNIDSLIRLREYYHASRSDTVSQAQKKYYTEYVASRSDHYKAGYIREHYFDYAVLNKLRILLKFCFPLRLDDIPLPKLSDMSLFQKMFKGFYMVLFHLVNLLGLLAGIIVLFSRDRKKILFYGFPFTFLLILGIYFGFIEMRYLAPVYPF